MTDASDATPKSDAVMSGLADAIVKALPEGTAFVLIGAMQSGGETFTSSISNLKDHDDIIALLSATLAQHRRKRADAREAARAAGPGGANRRMRRSAKHWQ